MDFRDYTVKRAEYSAVCLTGFKWYIQLSQKQLKIPQGCLWTEPHPTAQAALPLPMMVLHESLKRAAYTFPEERAVRNDERWAE